MFFSYVFQENFFNRERCESYLFLFLFFYYFNKNIILLLLNYLM